MPEMRTIKIRRGLNIPISGEPEKTITDAAPVSHIGLVGDDYPGMKPAMLVQVGDRVSRGQPLFKDRKNEGVLFTAPGSGEVIAINRGPKRKFESLVIRLDGDDSMTFCPEDSQPEDFHPDTLRALLIDAGLWCSLRTRPFGKIPPIDGRPASLFITAMDTAPLAPDLEVILEEGMTDFIRGMKLLTRALDVPVYLCLPAGQRNFRTEPEGVECIEFDGPHPAGLPSTHIHHVDPVHEKKTVWHIDAQDVIACGGLMRTGTLPVNRVVSIGGPAASEPRHLRTRLGASVFELCRSEYTGHEDDVRLVSGSVLDGRKADGFHGFLGRYHQLIACLPEGTGRQFFGWLRPGSDRFSITRAFLSTLTRSKAIPMDTAVWGGDRAIFPVVNYDKVMPLDVVPIYLLKSLASGNIEKSKELGCLEMVEEDLALCSYVCPGKNDFGPMLRETLTSIEEEG